MIDRASFLSSDVCAAFDVCAIGNAIMDVVASCEDAFLSEMGIAKGGMTLVDEARARALYAKTKTRIEMAGGSAANTAIGVAALGGKPAYIGKTGNDALGAAFRASMEDVGVHFAVAPLQDGPATAQCLIFVTPDAERSMNTFLGACVELSSKDIAPETIDAAHVTYLEGYLFDKPKAKDAFRVAAQRARGSKRLVALTLSDGFCVARHKDDFLNLIRENVDILIGNENELTGLYGVSDFDAALAAARAVCETVVGTRGANGAVVARGDAVFRIPPEKASAILDTTGAGDMFAAGFLFGVTHGLDLAESGRVGAKAAASVLSHYGPRPHGDLKHCLGGKA